MSFIQNILIMAPPILLALTLHEYAHGYVAYRMGDPTAKMMGRLTLNPLSHLDPLGTIAFFLIHFGWAKPVPVNGSYFKNPRQDMLWVALAGPVTNLVLAVASAILYKFITQLLFILPQSFFAGAILLPFHKMLEVSVGINLVLCIFNFLPIPPLDGSRILMGVLPADMARAYQSFEKYGFIVIILLMATGVLSKMILPILYFTGSFLLS